MERLLLEDMIVSSTKMLQILELENGKWHAWACYSLLPRATTLCDEDKLISSTIPFMGKNMSHIRVKNITKVKDESINKEITKLRN